MRIVLVPETDEERARGGEKMIENVKDFMLFGTNVVYQDENDSVGMGNEFHEWTGSYRYLMGTLQYYYQELNDERKEARTRRRMNSKVTEIQAPRETPELTVVPSEVEENEE